MDKEKILITDNLTGETYEVEIEPSEPIEEVQESYEVEIEPAEYKQEN